MMRNCKNCSENNWKYKYDKEMIIATCLSCGNKVKFKARERGKNKANDLCRRCREAKIIYKECKFKPSKLKKSYYYTGYYYCPKCKQIYHSEKFKIYNKPKTPAKAEYKIINNQRYLKIDNEFKKVELKTFVDKKGKEYLKVTG